MEGPAHSSVHGVAVLVGPRAVLIRGPAGAGKSRLALALLEAGTAGAIPFTRLVADDRVYLEAAHGRLLVRPPQALAGLIEIRGLGIAAYPFEPIAVVGLVVDLANADAPRLPELAEREVSVANIAVPRIAVAAGTDPFPLVVAALHKPKIRN